MMDQHLIEIGRQVCLTPNNTTGLTESNIHLRKFTIDQVKTMIAKNLQQVEKIEGKIGRSKDIEEKVELLSRQTGELCQMVAVLVSLQLCIDLIFISILNQLFSIFCLSSSTSRFSSDIMSIMVSEYDL